MNHRPHPVPADRPRLAPYITVADCPAALDFYRAAFGSEEVVRMTDPDGRIAHAELRIGGASLMVSDEFPDFGALGPGTIGGSPVMLHLYVEDADAVVARAVSLGAKLDRAVEDHFYGDRGGKIVDPSGHRWWIASRIEEVSPEEQKRRASELYGTV